MGMFSKMTTEGLEETEDKVGGGFEPMPSDIYEGTVKLAYIGHSRRSDAMSLNLHVDINGKELRDTIWFTNGKGQNFFVDKDTKKNVPLPGFAIVNDLCMFATEAELSEQETETKTVKLYNFEEKKELPTQVECLTALHDTKVQLAVLRMIEDKNKKGDDGEYHPTGETITKNAIDKVLHPETGRTINEYKHGIETPEFAEAWLTKNQNKDRNKAKGAASGGGGQAGTGAPGGGASKAKASLFGK